MVDAVPYDKGLIGNYYNNIPEVLAKEIRMADILASSSCFPGGFEPINFPQDFILPDVSELENFIQNSKYPIGLMDGGIVDNQGIEPLLLAEKRMKLNNPDCKDCVLDLIIISDVASPYMEEFTASVQQKENWWRSLTLSKIRNISTGILILSALSLTGSIIYDSILGAIISTVILTLSAMLVATIFVSRKMLKKVKVLDPKKLKNLIHIKLKTKELSERLVRLYTMNLSDYDFDKTCCKTCNSNTDNGTLFDECKGRCINLECLRKKQAEHMLNACKLYTQKEEVEIIITPSEKINTDIAQKLEDEGIEVKTVVAFESPKPPQKPKREDFKLECDYNDALEAYKLEDLEFSAEYNSHIPKNMREKTALSNQRNALIVSILICQGATTREIEKLLISDIDIIKATIKIQGGQHSNERVLPLKATQIGLFMHYLQMVRPQLLEYLTSIGANTDNTDKLFLSLLNGSRKKTGSSLGNIFVMLGRQLKTIDRQFQNFKQVRASVIALWIKTQGLRKAQYLAGHRYISSTESYQSNNLDGLIDDINKLHPFQ